MGTNPDVGVEDLAGEILGYLQSHAQAADTVEGIAHWWIKRQRLEATIARVQNALDRLVDEGRLQARVTPAGRTLYSLAGSRPRPVDQPR